MDESYYNRKILIEWLLYVPVALAILLAVGFGFFISIGTIIACGIPDTKGWIWFCSGNESSILVWPLFIFVMIFVTCFGGAGLGLVTGSFLHSLSTWKSMKQNLKKYKQ